MKTYDEMMYRAENIDIDRDKRRSENIDKNKKYKVMSFPAYHGSPVATNSFIVAVIILLTRIFSYAEVKIYDVKKDKYYIFGSAHLDKIRKQFFEIIDKIEQDMKK